MYLCIVDVGGQPGKEGFIVWRRGLLVSAELVGIKCGISLLERTMIALPYPLPSPLIPSAMRYAEEKGKRCSLKIACSFQHFVPEIRVICRIHFHRNNLPPAVTTFAIVLPPSTRHDKPITSIKHIQRPLGTRCCHYITTSLVSRGQCGSSGDRMSEAPLT